MSTYYCDCVKRVFDCLEAWHLQVFQRRKELNISKFRVAFQYYGRENPAGCMLCCLNAFWKLSTTWKKQLVRCLVKSNLPIESIFSLEYRKATLNFVHGTCMSETRVLLGAFKNHNGWYSRQLYPPGGRSHIENLFSIGFRFHFVIIIRMAFILFFRPDQLQLARGIDKT